MVVAIRSLHLQCMPICVAVLLIHLEIGDYEIPNYETKKMIECKVYRKLSCILDLSCELVPSTPRI